MSKFETETCSRCHGSGKYSYCVDYGDKCFKCGGSGIVLSKRGAVAKAFFLKSCEIEASQLVVGDIIKVSGITPNMRQYYYAAKIIDISRSQYESVSMSGDVVTRWFPLNITTLSEKFGESGLSCPDTNTVRIYRTDDNQRLQAALEYQKTLTKTGKVRKNTKVSK